MKIRQDFVTNSSSVSYIVTFCPALYETMNDFHRGGREDKEDVKFPRIEGLIKNDLFESGTRVFIEGHEMYVKKYEFDTEETWTDRQFEEQGDDIDFKNITDDELWNYIRGQLLGLGDLGHIYGFGVTQVDTY